MFVPLYIFGGLVVVGIIVIIVYRAKAKREEGRKWDRESRK